MDLLFHPNIYQSFLSNRFNLDKKNEDRVIESLISNNQNRHVISKALLNEVEKLIVDDEHAKTVMVALMPYLINSNSLNVKATDESTVDNILSTMYTEYSQLNEKLKRDLFFQISNDVYDDELSYCLGIRNIIKPNRHWLFINLACKNPSPLVIRYYDFKTDLEVKELFDNILDACGDCYVDIFDRQVNLEHSLFDSIRSNKRINYFTYFRWNTNEHYDKVDALKNFLRRVFIYRGNSDHIHERRIMVKNLIIEPDDDFWNLCCARTTWKVTITYCANTAVKLAEKKEHFQAVR